MKMDVEPLIPSANIEGLTTNRRNPVLLLVVLWSLGIISWSPPKDDNEDVFSRPIIGNVKFRRKLVFLSSIFLISIMAVISYFGAGMYFICFFGLKEHFLRFISVIVCYWPPLICGSIFFMPAMLQNNRRKSKVGNKKVSWIPLFRESTFLERLYHLENFNRFLVPKPLMFAFFHFCGLLVSFVILIAYRDVYSKCLTWLSYVWITSQLIAVTYFANFCYFLFLQRTILEDEYGKTESFIKENTGDLEGCIEAVKRFFLHYYRLRRLFLLWLSIILFSVTFGVAAYVTWSYKPIEVPHNSTVTTTQFPLNPEGIKKACPYSCDSHFLEGHYLLINNFLAFAKLFTAAVLSLRATGGLDIKYMWNDLILGLRLMSTTADSDFWCRLIKYADELHPRTTFDTKFRLIIPILGLAFGFLGGWQNK